MQQLGKSLKVSFTGNTYANDQRGKQKTNLKRSPSD